MWIVLGLLFLVFMMGLVFYNSMVVHRNNLENSFGTVDVQLKMRHDLIPKLVVCVQAYMNHEKAALEKITRLRNQAMKPGLSMPAALSLENQITQALSGLMFRIEAYPDFKSSENMMALQRSLNEVEAQIAAARRAFNASANVYNNAVEIFPGNLFSRILGYQRREQIAAVGSERVNPTENLK